MPTPPPPLPRRVAWFAPWTWFAHWKPWKRWTLFAGVMLVGYVEAPVALEVLDSRIPIPQVYPAFRAINAPIILAMEASPAIRKFYEVQVWALDDALIALGL